MTTVELKYSRGGVLAAFAAVYIVWGSTYLAIRFAVETIPPLLMAGGRFVISGAILYWWARAEGSATPASREWRAAAVSGTLLLLGGNGAVAWAEQRVPSGITALLVAVVPLWMVLLEWFRRGGTRPRLGVFIGLALGLLGLLLLVGAGSLSGHGAVSPIGALALMIGSFSWACGSIYNRHGARPESALMSTGLQMLTGGCALLVAAGIVGELERFRLQAVAFRSWIGFLYLVTFGSLVGFTAYVYLLRATTPAKASTYAYVNPIVAVLLGWAFAGEAITARTAVAAAIILAGVAIITSASSQPAQSSTSADLGRDGHRRVGDAAMESCGR